MCGKFYFIKIQLFNIQNRFVSIIQGCFRAFSAVILITGSTVNIFCNKSLASLDILSSSIEEKNYFFK
jgi:hypothetical protein